MKLLRSVLAAAAMAVVVAPNLPAGRAGETDKPKPQPRAKATAEAKAKWQPLFNGKDLTGWQAKGTAIFKVVDGCLMGTQTDGKGGDLFTTKEWDNFELRFTYRVKWPANSGVWFRTAYQFDILKWPKPVAFSGTLYCPGKMFLTSNLKEELENRDGWNEGQIYANGESLILWLNGHKVGECRDKTHAKGKVGIQVHGGNQFKGMEIHLKRFELRPLAKDEPPTPPKPPATQPTTQPGKKPKAG